MSKKRNEIKLKAEAIQKEIENKISSLKELEKMEKSVVEEEKQKKDSLKETIDNLCSRQELFCGAIFTLDDLFQMIRILKDTGDNTVKVGYMLYPDENK